MMWLQTAYNQLVHWRRASQLPRRQAARRRGGRLGVEQLEDRLVPSNFTAATVSNLIADINAANKGGGSNTIALVAGNALTLTAVDNTTDGATGLPVIAAKDNLTIVGNGDTITRSTTSGTPAFRLLDVTVRASLTLENLTLQSGLAFGSGVSVEGGGIYNQGTLDLNGVTVQNNTAQGQNGAGGPGANAYGGGVYIGGGTATVSDAALSSNAAQGGVGGRTLGLHGSRPWPGGSAYGGALYVAAGAVTLNNDTLSANATLGGKGGTGGGFGGDIYAANAGNGFGGGLYAAGGTVTLSNDTLSANAALGGPGGVRGPGGNGFGGGLYAAGGTVTLQDDTVTGNVANGGVGGVGAFNGLGEGGGLYIAPSSAVYLDAFTVANVINNTASTSDPNIDGSYTLIP